MCAVSCASQYKKIISRYKVLFENMGGCAGKQEITSSPGAESPYQDTAFKRRKSSEKIVGKSSNYDIVQLKPRPKISGSSPSRTM